MKKPVPLRAAVIGAGVTANLIHLPILARQQTSGVLTLALICDLDEARAMAAQRKFGFAMFCSDATQAVMRSDIDVVYVFGTAQMHYAYGLLALEHGKHLFVEKPVAAGYEQALALASAAEARGLIAVGGHNRRFYKALTLAKIRAGKAGWRYGEAKAHKPELGRKPPFGAHTWLGANGIHALDALVDMMGGLPAHLASLADGDPPSRFSAVMRWADGAQGVFLCDNNAGARREDYVFHAPGETCRIDADGLRVEREGRVSILPCPVIRDGFAEEHAAFLDAVHTKTAPRHAIAALAPSLFLAERIERGFNGPIMLPRPAALPRSAAEAGASILVTGSGPLQHSLGPLIGRYRMIGLEELGGATTWPQVRAALIGRGAPPLSDEILARLPNLGAVGVMGLSLARQRPETLLGRGITLFNASGAYAETVADFTFALAVLGRRQAFASHERMRRGGWGASLPPSGILGHLRAGARSLKPLLRAFHLEALARKFWQAGGPVMAGPAPAKSGDLKGATVGLVGWSANARAFAQRLHRSGAHVLVWSEHASAAELNSGDLGNIRAAALGDVLAADIVSLHRGLNPSTRHFLGEAELARLRPGALLINVARGALIDPDALVARLRLGDIFACLDTYEDEPLARDHVLRRLPNVFLTAHIAGGSSQMHEAAAREVTAKIVSWLDGEPVDPVTATRLATMT
jgi:phosphoglycerate dehydrogenase-like enzyme/predicted dehydrogenase